MAAIFVERVRLVEHLEKVLADRQADAQEQVTQLELDLQRAIEELDVGDKHRLLRWIRTGHQEGGGPILGNEASMLTIGPERRRSAAAASPSETPLEKLIAFYKLGADGRVEIDLDGAAAKYLQHDLV
jgi:hypothetical protein